MIETVEGAGNLRRSAISFLGRSLAQRQLDLLLTLGCKKVACLSDRIDDTLLALQHEAEAAGVRFHVISSPRALGGVITAADELVVVAEGVLPMAHEVPDQLGNNRAILAFPAEAGVVAGFERIDLNHAWAGLLIMPGSLVERLMELPPDCDVIASLLRIALQFRVPEKVLPEAVLAEGRWASFYAQDQAAKLEPVWLRRHAEPENPYAPGKAFVGWLVSRSGVRLLRLGATAKNLLAVAVALLLVALTMGWALSVGLGLFVLGTSWLLKQAADSFLRAEGEVGTVTRRMRLVDDGFDWILDLAMIAILALGLPLIAGDHLNRVLLPAIVLGLLRIIPAISSQNWTIAFSDRFLACLVLGIASLSGLLLPALQMLALGLIALGIVFCRAVRS